MILQYLRRLTGKEFSPSPATSRSGTVIGNSACLLVCLFAPVDLLTDKMERSAKDFFDSPGSHDDARKKKSKKSKKKMKTTCPPTLCEVVFLQILGSQEENYISNPLPPHACMHACVRAPPKIYGVPDFIHNKGWRIILCTFFERPNPWPEYYNYI